MSADAFSRPARMPQSRALAWLVVTIAVTTQLVLVMNTTIVMVALRHRPAPRASHRKEGKNDQLAANTN